MDPAANRSRIGSSSASLLLAVLMASTGLLASHAVMWNVAVHVLSERGHRRPG